VPSGWHNEVADTLKLKVLPQPDIFLRLMPGFAQAQTLELLLSRIFTPDRLERLQPLADKRLLFCTPGRELELLMCVDGRGIHILPIRGEVPDVTIRGDLAALTALCLGLEDSDTLFFCRRLLLTGDTSTGLLFKNILANLDFDLHDELEQHLGKRVADMLWRTAEQAVSVVERLDQSLASTGVALGERFGLVSAERAQSLETEISKMHEMQAKLQSGLERRRPGRLAST